MGLFLWEQFLMELFQIQFKMSILYLDLIEVVDDVDGPRVFHAFRELSYEPEKKITRNFKKLKRN